MCHMRCVLAIVLYSLMYLAAVQALARLMLT